MIYPHLLKFDFADYEHSKIEWFVSKEKNTTTQEHSNKKAKVDFEASLNWVKVHEGFYYIPNSSTINSVLKCVVYPGREDAIGDPFIHISPTPITAGPTELPYHIRHSWTKDMLAENRIRVTTYNILADLYADSDYSRTVLFAHCPAFALSMDYRIKLILDELIGYNSDIITLQECDRKIFELHLLPILSKHGFHGHFAKKGGQVDEGLATFYREGKFKSLTFSSCFLPDALQNKSCYSYILDKVKDNQQLMTSLINRTTTLSICVLECMSTNKILVIGNTHLYFSPNADHIRLIQTEMCRYELETIKKELKDADLARNVSSILCGDFNSTPPFGVLEYMTTGEIGDCHADWKSEKGEEIFGLSFSHCQKYASAAGTSKYTNYTQGFKDCLDYIFIEEESFGIDQVVPFPSEEELALHIALPNIAFPSDHIS